MPIYNPADLYNKYVQDQSAEAYHEDVISKETYQRITETYPVTLYTPNYFVRIGLGLLTVVSVSFSAMFLGLLSGSDRAILPLFILMAISCYTALELLVKSKNYYNAGIDNILMVAVLFFVAGAFAEVNGDSTLLMSSLIWIIALWMSIRFADAFMAVLSYLSMLSCLFLLYIKLGATAKYTAPFMLLIVSAVFYGAAQKLQSKNNWPAYRFCFKALTLTTLLTFYASVNFFIVKEGGKELLQTEPKTPLPFGWFFWMLTLLVPPLYLLYGILKKSLLFIRTGFVLLVLAVCTVRYYYALLPIEWALLIAGLLMLVVSYLLIRYLKTPKKGFVFKNTSKQEKGLPNAEGVAVAEVFGKKTTIENHWQFGGGSGGGAGAGGNW